MTKFCENMPKGKKKRAGDIVHEDVVTKLLAAYEGRLDPDVVAMVYEESHRDENIAKMQLAVLAEASEEARGNRIVDNYGVTEINLADFDIDWADAGAVAIMPENNKMENGSSNKNETGPTVAYSAIEVVRKMILEKKEKITVILRGLPGSGKSFLAKKLKYDGVIISADQYFVDRHGRYQYKPGKLNKAHMYAQQKALTAMSSGVHPVVIDNTNLQTWEMCPYVKSSRTYGYIVQILEPDTWWRFTPSVLAKKNKHGVPEDKIKKMLERYHTEVTVGDIVVLLDKNSSRKKKSMNKADQFNNSPSRCKSLERVAAHQPPLDTFAFSTSFDYSDLRDVENDDKSGSDDSEKVFGMKDTEFGDLLEDGIFETLGKTNQDRGHPDWTMNNHRISMISTDDDEAPKLLDTRMRDSSPLTEIRRARDEDRNTGSSKVVLVNNSDDLNGQLDVVKGKPTRDYDANIMITNGHDCSLLQTAEASDEQSGQVLDETNASSDSHSESSSRHTPKEELCEDGKNVSPISQGLPDLDSATNLPDLDSTTNNAPVNRTESTEGEEKALKAIIETALSPTTGNGSSDQAKNIDVVDLHHDSSSPVLPALHPTNDDHVQHKEEITSPVEEVDNDVDSCQSKKESASARKEMESPVIHQEDVCTITDVSSSHPDPQGAVEDGEPGEQKTETDLSHQDDPISKLCVGSPLDSPFSTEDGLPVQVALSALCHCLASETLAPLPDEAIPSSSLEPINADTKDAVSLPTLEKELIPDLLTSHTSSEAVVPSIKVPVSCQSPEGEDGIIETSVFSTPPEPETEILDSGNGMLDSDFITEENKDSPRHHRRHRPCRYQKRENHGELEWNGQDATEWSVSLDYSLGFKPFNSSKVKKNFPQGPHVIGSTDPMPPRNSSKNEDRSSEDVWDIEEAVEAPKAVVPKERVPTTTSDPSLDDDSIICHSEAVISLSPTSPREPWPCKIEHVPSSNLVLEKREMGRKKSKRGKRLAAKFDNEWMLEELTPVVPVKSVQDNKVVVPQAHCSTETCAEDFLRATSLNIEENQDVKVLSAVGERFVPSTEVGGMVLLDKSCTAEFCEEQPTDASPVEVLCKLFSGCAKSDISSLLEDCKGDVAWAANILLDSGYSMDGGDTLPGNKAEEGDVPTDEVVGACAAPVHQDSSSSEDTTVVDNPALNNQSKESPSGHSRGSSHHSSADDIYAVQEQLKERMLGKVVMNSESMSEHRRRITGKHRTKRREEQERESASGSSSSEEESQRVWMSMNLPFASQLTENFGSPCFGLDASELSGNDLEVVLPLSLCKVIHSHWQETLKKKYASQSKELEKIIRDNGTATTAPTTVGNLNNLPPTTMKEIMDLEKAIENSVKDQDNCQMAMQTAKTYAATLAANRLQLQFPDMDPQLLQEVFTACDGDYAKTVVLLQNNFQEGVEDTASVGACEEGRRERDAEEILRNPSPEDFRAECSFHYDLMHHYNMKAREAYGSGQKEAASVYAQQAGEHQTKLGEANRRASETILTHNNRKQPGYVLDLHHLYVKEAMTALREWLEEKNKGTRPVTVLTGWGKHSRENKAVLRPAVEKYLNEHGYDFTEQFEGRFLVKPKKT